MHGIYVVYTFLFLPRKKKKMHQCPIPDPTLAEMEEGGGGQMNEIPDARSQSPPFFSSSQAPTKKKNLIDQIEIEIESILAIPRGEKP